MTPAEVQSCGHFSTRYLSTGMCTTCEHEKAKAWQIENPEEKKASDARYAAAHKEERKTWWKAWLAKHKEPRNAARRAARHWENSQ